MTAFVLPYVLGVFGIAILLTLYRLCIGPSLVDRVLALDTLYINALAFLILLGIWIDNTVFFEAALVIALLGFVSTVAASRYLAQGSVAE